MKIPLIMKRWKVKNWLVISSQEVSSKTRYVNYVRKEDKTGKKK